MEEYFGPLHDELGRRKIRERFATHFQAEHYRVLRNWVVTITLAALIVFIIVLTVR